MSPYATHAKDYLLNLRLGWLHYLNWETRGGRHATTKRRSRPGRPRSRPSSDACSRSWRLGKSQEAAALAREILKDHPNNYYASLRLAVALRLQKKYDDARRILQHT